MKVQIFWLLLLCAICECFISTLKEHLLFILTIALHCKNVENAEHDSYLGRFYNNCIEDIVHISNYISEIVDNHIICIT